MTAFSTSPQRSESFRWRIYDKDDTLLGDLMVAKQDTPVITNDTTRSIRRSVTNVTVLSRPVGDTDASHLYASEINPLTMRVKPVMVFGDGTEYPLGVFIWGDASTQRWSSGDHRKGTLTDKCAQLDQPLSRSVGFSAGTSLDDAIKALLPGGVGDIGAIGDGADVGSQAVNLSGALLGVAIGFAAGRDTSLTALDTCCKNAGFLPPYYNNNGTLVLRNTPNVATAPVDFAYGQGLGGVVPGSVLASSDLMTAPNRYIIVGSNPKQELVGIFDVPDSAPNSFANRGFYIVKSDTLQGVSTQAQVDQAAATAYATDISSYTWLSFDAARINPLHDTWNIVSFDGIPFREVSWTMQCKTGGHMTHSLRGAIT